MFSIRECKPLPIYKQGFRRQQAAFTSNSKEVIIMLCYSVSASPTMVADVFITTVLVSYLSVTLLCTMSAC